MSNPIWTGQIYIRLRKELIHPACKWAHGNYHGNYIKFVNRTFARFSVCRTQIATYGDAAHRKRMTAHLEKMAKKGFGLGVCDFREACHHVWSNLGEQYRWTDTNVKYGSFNGWGTVPAVSTRFPTAIVNFVNAMQHELEEMDTTFLEELFPNIDKVIRAFNQGKYDGILQVTEEIHKLVKQVDKFLYLVPDEQEYTFGKISKIYSYTQVFSTFDKAYQDLLTYRSAGITPAAAGALVALRNMMGCVPVLGKVYESLIDALPSFFTQMAIGFQSRQQRILNHSSLP